jgi:hypothetical protein
MSYYINDYSSYGLWLAGEKDISAFIEKTISVSLEEVRWCSSAANLKRMAEEAISETDLAKKVKDFSDFMDSALEHPFVFVLDEDKVDPDHPRPLLDIRCNDWDENYNWNEEPVELIVKALAPFMKAGNYLGFIGEDGEMWSYVFDGKGSYTYVLPVIDWTCGLYPAAK